MFALLRTFYGAMENPPIPERCPMPESQSKVNIQAGYCKNFQAKH